MDVTALAPPNAPATGRLGGQEFNPDRVEFKHDQITFRQGKEFFADKEIKVWLSGDHDSVEGLKIEVKPEERFSMATPHVHTGVKKPGGNLPETNMYMDKYAMKLELGKIENGKLPGKIHICLPDNDKSYLAGTFSIDAKGLGTSRITGKVALPAGVKEIKLTASYLGQDLAGEQHSGHVGFTVGPGQDRFVGSFASKLESKKDGVSFRHVRVPAGTYLVFVGWDKRALAWKWVDVKDRSEAKVDLAVEVGGTGDLEVALPAGAKERRVTLLPLDADGKLPAAAGNPSHLAMQLSNNIHEMAAEAPAGQDKVTFAGLRSGTYRVFAGEASADAVVKTGAMTRANLSAPKGN